MEDRLAVLTVCSGPFPSCLVVAANQTVMDEQRTDWIIAEHDWISRLKFTLCWTARITESMLDPVQVLTLSFI